MLSFQRLDVYQCAIEFVTVALEIGAPHVSAALLRPPPRDRGRPEDGGDGERDCAGGDQNDSLHDDSLLRLRLPDESSHRAVGFVGAGCYGAVSL